MDNLKFEYRKKIAESVRVELNKEMNIAVKNKNKAMIEKIDRKLKSLGKIYQLSELE